MNFRSWAKTGLIIASLGLISYFAPAEPLDPWNLLSLKKVSRLVFFLALIQGFGLFVRQLFGTKMGAMMTGFFGGLVSSTATTASLAHESKTSLVDDSDRGVLVFMSATLAMLLEAMVLVAVGLDSFPLSLSYIFLGPILVLLLLLYFSSKKIETEVRDSKEGSLEIWSLIKLSLFILLVLSLSLILQKSFGDKGLYLLTFLVSLFEIHGSVIANTQLLQSHAIGIDTLGSLVAISIFASVVSKLFLIYTLAKKELRKKVTIVSMFLFASLFLSWLLI